MSRESKKSICILMGRLASALGLPEADSNGMKGGKFIVGALSLDYVPQFGGARIEQISNDKGTCNQPFGAHRQSLSELAGQIRFALDSLRVLEKTREASKVIPVNAELDPKYLTDPDLKPGFVRCQCRWDETRINLFVLFGNASPADMPVFKAPGIELSGLDQINAFRIHCGVGPITGNSSETEDITQCPEEYLEQAKAAHDLESLEIKKVNKHFALA